MTGYRHCLFVEKKIRLSVIKNSITLEAVRAIKCRVDSQKLHLHFGTNFSLDLSVHRSNA